MIDHPFGALSLLPPLVAIVLAMLTRKAVFSLLMGILCGSLITNNWSPIGAVIDFAEVHLWPTLADSGKLRIFSFTLTMGAMIGVISRGGGMLGLIELIKPIARTKRSGQLVMWLSGMVIFFDDYANTVLLGGTLRPLSDRLKISREKLAYIVDSTAAPLASLAFLSTWIAVEIDYIAEGIAEVEPASVSRAMEIFLASVPYRFYPIMALLMVPLLVITRRDFGPMTSAERNAGTSANRDTSDSAEDPLTKASSPAGWWTAVIPIVVTLTIVVVLLYTTGHSELTQSGVTEPLLREILGAASSSLALQYGAIGGLATSVVISMWKSLLDANQIRQACWGGIRVVLPAILILWTASALSRLTGSKSVDGVASEAFEFQDHRLYTGQFVADLILSSEQTDSAPTDSPSLFVRLIPTTVFVLAAILSFATGTSYGTMGLLMPMAITMAAPLVTTVNGDSSVDLLTHPLMLVTVASVLSGAVFGDHCSPISDTTILSSQACGCDHMAHVMTQIPYAATVAVVSILAGTLPLGWGIDWRFCLLVQLVVLFGLVVSLGSRNEETSIEKPIDGTNLNGSE